MRAFFLAYGPAFQKGVSLDPFHNVDLFPLMCKLIELDPPKHDGNLQRVNRALVASGVPEETTDDPNSSSTHASTQMMTLLLFRKFQSELPFRMSSLPFNWSLFWNSELPGNSACAEDDVVKREGSRRFGANWDLPTANALCQTKPIEIIKKNNLVQNQEQEQNRV